MTDIGRAALWGTWVMGGVLLLVLYRSEALTAAGSGTLEARRAAYVASVCVWLATAWLLSVPDRGARLRRPAVFLLGAIALGATVAVTLTVPAGSQHTSENWAVGVNGWLLLTIASGARLPVLVMLLTTPVVFALAVAVTAGPAETVVMTARIAGIAGLQLPIALAIRALERSAEATRELHLARESIRTAQLVAAALHGDRMRRSRTVAAAVEPVLARLADPSAGTAPDETLRRSSRIAAAQVRRLLAEWHRGDGDPLGDDLSACLNDLQATGTRVEITIHADGLPAAMRRAAGEVVRECARLSADRLRLTVVRAGGRLCLSVVARTGAPGTRFTLEEAPAPVVIRTTAIGQTVWVELTCPV
jgi:hypothetical protein